MTIGSPHVNQIYDIDPVAKTTTFLCETPRSIFGATSPTEFLASDCAIRFDFDKNDSSGATGGDFLSPAVCGFPPSGLPISDTTDTQIEVGFQRIDSLRLRILPASGNVFLAPMAIGSVSLGNSTAFSATFLGDPTVDFAPANADFQKSILASRLKSSGPVAPATFIVEAILFAKTKRDTAFSTFQIAAAPSAGRDSSIQICQNSSLFDLKNLLSADAAPLGAWSPAAVLDPKTAGEQLFSYVVEQGDCPADTAFFAVSVVALPVFSLGLDQKICATEPFPTLAAPVATAIWQDGSVGATFAAAAAGLFWAEVKNAIGCAWRDTVWIEKMDSALVVQTVEKCKGQVFEWQNLPLASDTSICQKAVGANSCDSTNCLELRFFVQKMSLDTTICAGKSLFWNGQTLVDSGLFRDTANVLGCLTERTLRLTVESVANFTVSVGPDASILEGKNYAIPLAVTGLGPFEYAWSPDAGLSCADCASPIAAPLDSTVYEVQVRDANGCLASDSLKISVLRQTKIYAPNAFSPNGDGWNDLFKLFSDPKNECRIERFLIFDRWGELVFDQKNLALDDPAAGWDGRFRGREMPAAFYVWLAELRLATGEKIDLKGEVTLLR